MKNKRLVCRALALPLVASLAACGGGGGGGGGGTSQVRPTPEPEPIVTTGKALSQTVGYVFDGSSQRFTLVAEPSAVSTEGSFVQETTPDGSITKLTIDTGTETIAFDRAAGDTFTTAGTSSMFVLAENLNGAHAALVLSPTGRAALGWNYQSFGVWEPGTETGAGATGVLSYGTSTPTAAIPASGSATYVGLLGGQYINADGIDHVLTANLTATVDFGNRALNLQSANTNIISAAAPSPTEAPGLNLSGTASYAAGSDTFSGALSSAGGTLSGNTTGRFYGPNAEEIGGVGALKAASGVESLQFAFGAKKQ